jgi:hypothetical protein
MKLVLMLVMLLAASGIAAAEDVVLLKDGQEVSGKILSETEKEIRILVGESEFILPRSLVAEVRRGDAKPPEGAPEEKAPDAVRLRADGRVITGKILAEDEKTVTMRVGEATLGFDKEVLEWIRRDGETRRLDAPAAPPPAEAAPERPARERRPMPEASPALEKWLKVCMENLASEDPMVRRSAGLALRALGPAARPALEKAAKGDDPALAETAKRLLEQGPRGGEGRGGRNQRGNWMDRLAERLELSEEQKPGVAKVFEEMMQARRELMQSIRDGELSREEAGPRMQEIGEMTEAKLSEILSAEQMETYREMMQGMRRRAGGGRGRDR